MMILLRQLILLFVLCAAVTTVHSLPVETPGVVRKVYALYFNPIIANGQDAITYYRWARPEPIQNTMISFFKNVSNNFLTYQIVRQQYAAEFPQKADGFTYTGASYDQCRRNNSFCHKADIANYLRILNRFSVCQLLNNGTIHELWMWGGGWFGFWESNLAGPGAFWYNSAPTLNSTCKSLLPIMGFNYEVGWDNAVHSFGHRMENSMRQAYGSWVATPTHAWNNFTLLNKDQRGLAGCGNTHYPPNAVRDYDYSNTTSVLSNCDRWNAYPDVPRSPVNINCNAWKCNQGDYMRWWFSHLPKYWGKAMDGRLNNWWRYMINYTDAIARQNTASYGGMLNNWAIYGGNNLTKYTNVANSSVCSAKCSAFTGCKAWTYNKCSKICYLKNGTLSHRVDTCYVSFATVGVVVKAVAEDSASNDSGGSMNVGVVVAIVVACVVGAVLLLGVVVVVVIRKKRSDANDKRFSLLDESK